MNTISEYLIQYLTLNRSVSLGKLGIFYTQHTEISIHPIVHEFHPPSALLSFEEDASCETSSQFIQFVEKNACVTRHQAIKIIDDFTSEVLNALKTNNSFYINYFGTFKKLPNHFTHFEQDKNIQLNAMAFGMPYFTLQADGKMKSTKTGIEQAKQTSIVMPKLEKIEKPVVEEFSKKEIIPQVVETYDVTEPIVASLPQETIQSNNQLQAVQPKKKRRRSLILVFILLFLAASGGTLHVSGYLDVVYEKAKSIAAILTKSETAVTTTDSQITATGGKVQPPSAQTSEVQDTIGAIAEEQTQEQVIHTPTQNQYVHSQHHKYFIVADCFRDIQLAEKRVKALQSQGYNSSVAGQTKQGLYIVTYGGFAEKAEAEKMFKYIKQNVQSDSWLYIK